MDIIIVGGFSEVIELCELAGHRIVGIFDKENSEEILGYPNLGNDNIAFQEAPKFTKYPVIISPDLPQVRKKIVQAYYNSGYKFINVISPNSFISKSASLGNGNVIQSHVNISASVHLGNFIKVNTSANIMHDVKVGDYSTIAPNAVILGRVEIGGSVYVGANATILPDKTIAERAIIGAGAVVTKNVEQDVTCVGNPARQLKK